MIEVCVFKSEPESRPFQVEIKKQFKFIFMLLSSSTPQRPSVFMTFCFPPYTSAFSRSAISSPI